MITVFKTSRQSALAILPALAIVFAGCAKEADEATSTGGTSDGSSAEAGGDVADATGATRAETEEETTTTNDSSPSPTQEKPLIIPDTPNIPVAGSDTAEKPEEGKELWLTDYALAKEKAAAENKSILMDFTGSDWCGWCIRLQDEVFKFPEFQDYAAENLILLELDFPRGKRLPADLVAQNEELQEKFSVQGFPTIILTDSEGLPIGQTGYQEGGPQAYVEHLQVFVQGQKTRDKALAAADKAEGVERAKHLDAAVAALPAEIVFPWYESTVEEIIQLDAQDEAGLKTQYGELLLQRQVEEKLAVIENLLRRSSDEEKILAEFTKLETEFAEYAAGLIQIRLLKCHFLARFDKWEDLLVLAGELRQVEGLPDDERVMVFGLQAMAHENTDRPEKALEVIEVALGEFETPDNQWRLLITKAQLLVKVKKNDEAREAIAAAREKAPDEYKTSLEQYAKELLKDSPADETEAVEKPEPTEESDSTTKEKPAKEKPAEEKPAEEKPAESDKEAKPASESDS